MSDPIVTCPHCQGSITLTGPRFRQRIQAIIEAFVAMQEDLNAEKRAVQRQWAMLDAPARRTG